MNFQSRKYCLSLILPVVLGLLSVSAQAEIYKWIDAEGKTHYSQTPPPPEVQSRDIGEEIGLAAGKPSGGHAGSTATARPEKAEQENELDQARKEGEEKRVKHQVFCDQQNAALKQLLANPVIRWKAGDEDKILSAKEREEKITAFQDSINKYCSPEVLTQSSEVQNR
ncbi:MAG TPA: DUF4124 domain-containing protein [Thiolinea sp.]|nr:DUF4124 domain-containing protein [Thiolinea sp.]